MEETIFVIMGGEEEDKKLEKATFWWYFVFSEKDLEGIQVSHQDPLVNSIVIRKTKLLHVLIDMGAFVDILYWDMHLQNLHLKMKTYNQIQPQRKALGNLKSQ